MERGAPGQPIRGIVGCSAGSVQTSTLLEQVGHWGLGHHLRSRDPGGLSSSEKWSRYLNIGPNIHALLPPSIPWMVSQSQAQICSPPLWRSASGMPFPLSAFLDGVHVSKPSKPKSTFSPVSFVRITAVKLQMLLQSWGWKLSTTMVKGYLYNHNMAKRNLLVGVR